MLFGHPEIEPDEATTARLHRHEPEHRTHDARLSRPRLADDGEGLAAAQRKTDALYRAQSLMPECLVADRDPFDAENR